MNLEYYLSCPLHHETHLRRLFDSSSRLLIFDVGACEGEDTIRYARMFPNSEIHCFEPLDGNFKKLRDNLERFGVKNAICNQTAVSDQEGIVPFYVSSGTPDGVKCEEWDYGNKASSLLAPSKEIQSHYPWLKFAETRTVKTIRLDGYMEAKSINSIDFFHIDIQGAELKALEGLGQRIEAVRCIWIEVEAVSLYRGQPLKPEVENFLIARGFTRLLDTVEGVTGDQLWLNTKNFNMPKGAKKL